MQDSPSSQQGYGFHIGSLDRGQQVPILPLRVHVDKRRTSQWRLPGPLNQYRRGVHPSRRRDRFPKAMADNIGRRTKIPQNVSTLRNFKPRAVRPRRTGSGTVGAGSIAHPEPLCHSQSGERRLAISVRRPRKSSNMGNTNG